MKRTFDLLSALAADLGLAAPAPGARAVTGRLGGAQARLMTRSHGSARWLMVHLSGPPRAGPLCFERNRPWPRARRRARTLTGDLRFDGRVLTYGAPPLVAAVMTDGARAWVLDLLGDGDGLWIGARRLLFRARLDGDGDPVPDLVRRVRRLAGGWRRWDRLVDLPSQWFENALADRDRRVRALNAGRYLRVAAPGGREGHFDRTVSMGWPNRELNIEALASLAGAAGLPAGLREEAVLLLAGDDAGAEALAGLLHRADDSVLRVVVSLLVERHPDPVAHLVSALSRAESPAVVLFAEALAVLEDERAVPGLLGLLARPDERVQAAAFDALGRTGTLAIAPLLAAEADRRTTGLVHTAAVRAYRALRSRFPAETGSAQGAVSLSAHPTRPVAAR